MSSSSTPSAASAVADAPAIMATPASSDAVSPGSGDSSGNAASESAPSATTESTLDASSTAVVSTSGTAAPSISAPATSIPNAGTVAPIPAMVAPALPAVAGPVVGPVVALGPVYVVPGKGTTWPATEINETIYPLKYGELQTTKINVIYPPKTYYDRPNPVITTAQPKIIARPAKEDGTNDDYKCHFYRQRGNPPPGIGDIEWDKRYNAADTFIQDRVMGVGYLSHKKAIVADARTSGATRALAIQYLIEFGQLQDTFQDTNP